MPLMRMHIGASKAAPEAAAGGGGDEGEAELVGRARPEVDLEGSGNRRLNSCDD
jgi:hypothetical protein